MSNIKWAWDTGTHSPEERAAWLLENDWRPEDVEFVYTRDGAIEYKKPRDGQLLPPWWSTDVIALPDPI